MEALLGIFSAFGLSASAGLNAYIPLLAVALIARYTDLLHLSPPFDTLTSPWVIGLLVVLLLIETLADKVPAVNHVNDIIQSFVRPAAGALVFAASAHVIEDIHPILALGSGLIVAGGVNTVKSVAVRPMVTATTAGAGNVVVSVLEDIISTVVSILALVIPAVMAIVIFFIIGWIIWRLSARSNAPRPANSGPAQWRR